MFCNAASFNQDVSEWKVSNVKDMSFMFCGAHDFNQDVGVWDVCNVTDMNHMFHAASSFNNDVSSWDVTNVIDMKGMFYKASSFCQDLSNWDISKVANMSYIFTGATALRKKVDLSSFSKRVVGGEEWRRRFATAFHWNRRKYFLLFLVKHCYLSVTHTIPNDYEVMPCDVLFDVEDIDRIICKFL